MLLGIICNSFRTDSVILKSKTLWIAFSFLLTMPAWAVDISGTVNTYVKGDGDVSSGSTTINYTGSFRGAGSSISAGDTLLLLQVQGADIDSSNTDTYGDGVGSGANISTTPTSAHGTDGYAGGLISQTAGTFEYVQVSSVSAPTITLTAGVEHDYLDSDEANWQIIVVPDYLAAGARLIGNVSGAAWDGDTGGVVAFSATGGTIDFNGFTVDAAEIGFRGGVEGNPSATTDNIADVVAVSNDAGAKGEGVAGTPRYVYDGASVIDEGASTLPGGDYGRGAPGNAGGGAGPHNSGGGGGSNAGRGGIGAQGWVTGTPVHFAGYGGQSIFAGANFGGGGGSGESNDNSTNHGGPGGGLILLRADTGIGSGLLSVAGGDAPDATLDGASDGAGGGGAAGTVLVYFATPPTLAGLNVDASGGAGGDGDPAHGGGGGGGAGLVVIRATVGTIDVSGGVKGENEGSGGVASEAGGDGVVDTGSNAYVRLNTDYGDMPDSYGTISGADGAYHFFADYDFDGVIGGTEELYLGALIDGEGGGNPSTAATSDDTSNLDDEDGISSLSQIDPDNASYSIPSTDIFITNSYGTSATLHGWIDFDLNGTFESDEHTSVSVATGLSNANPAAGLSWSSMPGIGSVTPGSTTYMRLRLTTDSAITSSVPTGEAENGEVEDYALTVFDASPTPENISRSNPAGESTNANEVVFAVSFSEDVQNVDTSDFSVNGSGTTGASVTAVSGSGSSYTVTVDVGDAEEGEVNLDVANTTGIQDLTGNDLSTVTPTGTDQSYTLDNTAPTVQIQNVPAETNGAFTATFEFSEDVNDFVLGDITVGNGTAGSFTAVDGNTYTAQITPTAEGTVTIDVGGSVATDDAGNNNTAASQASTQYDATVPTVQIQNVPADTNGAFTATFEFSEDVNDFVLGDIAVGNGTAGSFTAVDGNTYTAQITPTAEGTVTIDVAGSVATDDAGNNNTAASQASTQYDITQPTVQIQNVPADTNGAFTATFEFSEDVNDFVLGDITVGNGTAGSFTSVDGNTYTAQITPTAEGTVTIDVAGSVATDDAGNNNTAASQASTQYDITVPTVQIQNVPADTNGAFTATFEFSEDVNDFVLGDITVGNGTAGSFTAVDGNTYTAQITPTAEGTVTIDVGSSVATDDAGNNNTAASQASTQFDSTAPTVQIQNVPTDTNGAFTATFEFSEDVNDFVLGDITVGNGTAGSFTAVDGNTYTAQITPTAEGTVTIDVAGSVATDDAGNNNTAASQASTQFDSTAPTVQIQNVPTDTNGAFTATFEFSEDVNDFVLGDITVGNGTAGSFTAVDGNTYTAQITPTAEGTVTIDVAGSVATDDAGNNNTAASQASTQYDITAPTVQIQNAPADTNGAFTATFEFSEDVNDFVVGDITVGNGTAGSFTAVDGNTYTAQITPTVEGTVTIDVGSSVATDDAGNNNTAASQASTQYDITAPTVQIQNAPADTNGAFTATFEFSEDVNDFVVGDITVGNGTAGSFTAVDGNTYTAQIIPTAEGAVTIDVAGSVATDDAGNNNTAASQASTQFDSTAPTVQIQNVPADTNGVFTATFEFSEDVNDFVLGDITVGNGTAGSFTAVDGNTYTAQITPTAEGTVTIDVAGSVATDDAGNNNTAASQASTQFDSTVPTVQIQNVPADTNAAFTATFEFSEDVNDFVLGDITVGNGTAGSFTAVDGNTYTAQITPTAEGAVTIDVAGSVATDDAGNNNTAASQASTQYDITAPTVQIQNTPDDANGAFTATFEFSEDVNDFVVGDITVGNGTAGSFTAVDSNTYTAQITPTSEGAVTIDVGSGVATDNAGNDNSAATQVVTQYDTTVPSVQIQNTPSDTNAAFTATFEFSEDVNDFVLGDITVGNGTAGSFVAVDGNTYTAQITPTAEGAVTLDVGSAVATDDAGNNNSAATQVSVNFDTTSTSAPAVTITEDTDDNGIIGSAELSGDIDVTVSVPGDAVTGDVLTINDGNGNTVNAILGAADIGSTVDVSFTSPGDTGSVNAVAYITDAAGNVSSNGTDAVTLDLTSPTAPGIVITEDADNNGEISDLELSGDVGVQVTLPVDAVAGDQVVVDYGSGSVSATISSQNITDGNANLEIAGFGNGDTLTVQAYVEDQAGNASALSTQDTALINTDSDNDGVPNSQEQALGTDPNQTDSDLDGIPDVVEIVDVNSPQDSDGDGTIDALDPDDDNDGIPTAAEDRGTDDSDPSTLPSDADADGIADYLDIDSDGDDIADGLEQNSATTDSDGDGIVDSIDADDDGTLGTDAGKTDANGDGVIDDLVLLDTDADGNPDIIDVDSDNDGTPDQLELGGSDIDTDLDGIDDGIDADRDGVPGVDSDRADANGDGFDDNFVLLDADADGIPDYRDADSDNDGVPDALENDIALADADNDGLDDAFDADIDGVPGVDSGLVDDNNDGIEDTAARRDSDLDATPDMNDLDSDNDGLPDIVESGWSGVDVDADGIDDAFDADLDGIPGEDVFGSDSNGDGILDDVLNDGDSDGLADLVDADSDNDGIPDEYENGASGVDADADGIDDAFDADLDGVPGTDSGFTDANGDGYIDTIALLDADGDGLLDYLDADSDNDGLSDAVENGAAGVDADADGIDDAFDADLDGIPGTDSGVVDADGDGIIDDLPVLDSDGDGIPNYQDLDSDNDGIPDVVEAGITDENGDGIADGGVVLSTALDSDTDSVPDYLDSDSDNDGFPDVFEAGLGEYDQNGDGEFDTATDSDGDGLADVIDNLAGFGLNDDIDGDGIANHLDSDDDNDGIPDSQELGGTPTLSGTDSDGDGIDDAIDVDNTGGIDANNDGIDDALDGDTDNDGIPDYQDSDADNDGVPDVLESDPLLDSDGDGIINVLDADSDNDGINDGDENTALPALSGNDSDNDGIDDAVDVDATFGTDANANGIDDLYEPSDVDGDGIADHLDSDADNDGIPDILEGNLDSDGDGLSNAHDTDSDNDGIPDIVEVTNLPNLSGVDSDFDGIDDALDVDLTSGADLNGNGIDDQFDLLDSDADGLVDVIDVDSDNDGIPDAVEASNIPALTGVDSDNDGIDDALDADVTGGQDSNGDGVDDLFGALDTDSDGIPNFADADSDNDGISDAIEADVSGIDTDADGIDDLFDVDQTGGIDSDGDGLDDSITPTNTDNDAVPDYLDLDSDNDSLLDVVEAGLIDADADGQADGGAITTSPTNTDGDGLANFRDLDSDGDGFSDLEEHGDGSLDANNDGQVDNATDSDGDGVPDSYDYEPNQFGGSLDSDGDGVVNHLDLDDDNDGILDSIENLYRVAVSGNDVNSNNIDDAWDAALTGGRDLNQDGIDDFLYGDTDGDGRIDSLDGDSDNDGISDFIEAGLTGISDSNHDAVIDSFIDVNGDGLDDRVDLAAQVLNSDGTDLPDFQDLDADNDGIYDLIESGMPASLDANGDGQIDSVVDQDQDGVPDSVDAEVNGAMASVLNAKDTDGDGVPDYLDEDSDGDGFPDELENGDFDGDGVNDGLQDTGQLETAVKGGGSLDWFMVLLLLAGMSLNRKVYVFKK